MRLAARNLRLRDGIWYLRVAYLDINGDRADASVKTEASPRYVPLHPMLNAVGFTTAEAARVEELEREVRELKKANEILRLASAYFAQAELDRRNK